MKCEACGYQFLFASSTQCPSCGDPREDIMADGYDFLTANAVPIMDSIVGLKAANAHLVRQLAVQALAHAEQMEGLRAKAADMLLAKNFRIANLESQLAMRVTPATTKLRCCDNGHTPFVWESDVDICSKCGLSGPFILKPVNAWINKVTAPPADTPPPERRPDGTLKPVAKAWEAPKQASDARRIGG